MPRKSEKKLPSKKTVERFLSNYLDGSLQRSIIMRKEELEFRQNEAEDAGVRVTTNRNTRGPQEGIVERRDSDYLYMRWTKAYASIDLFFKELNSIERKVLILKYKEQRRWKEISYNVNYSIRACFDIRDRLIDELRDILNFLV